MFYAKVKPHPTAEGPSPREAGLSPERAYRVIQVDPGETWDDEAFFTVINDEGEVWFLSNRHFRVINPLNFSIPLERED